MQNAHNIPRSYNLQVWERCWIVITRRRNYRRLIAINLVFVTYYLLPKTPFQWALDWETPFRRQKFWISSLWKYFVSLSGGHWYAFISRSAMALHLRCPFPFDLTTSTTHISLNAPFCVIISSSHCLVTLSVSPSFVHLAPSFNTFQSTPLQRSCLHPSPSPARVPPWTNECSQNCFD